MNIDKIITESINKVISSKEVFRLDEISKITLLNDTIINENDNSWILRKRNWEINNYHRFIEIVEKTPRKYKGYLTQHPLEEIEQDDWVTYTLKGYDVAFALHFIENGKIDICNLVNNSDLRGIGDAVLTFAKMQGGTQMDNYKGFLGDKYRKNGFNRVTWEDEFNPEFLPKDEEWRLTPQQQAEKPGVEGLELSKHRMKYNNPLRGYKSKFDSINNKKFNK